MLELWRDGAWRFTCIVVVSAGLLSADAPVSIAEEQPSAAGQSIRVPLTARSRSRAEALAAVVDPRTDGWQTESRAEAITQRLKRIVAAAADSRAFASIEFLAEDFVGQSLIPASFPTTLRHDLVEVGRYQRQTNDPERAYRGRDGLATALAELRRALPAGQQWGVGVKVFDIRDSDEQPVALARVQISALSEGQRLQFSAVWRSNWRWQAGHGPLLTKLEAETVELARGVAPGRWFSDATDGVLGRNESLTEQLDVGVDRWLLRIEERLGIHDSGRHGVAIGDVNGDDLEDLYICQTGGLPNRLFVQESDGTAVDRSAESGVDWLDPTASALFVDLDNDGDQDLALATVGALLVMENNGHGVFTLATRLSVAADVKSLSAADYDQDGDLDLYACVDLAAAEDQRTGRFVYHDANDGGKNTLYRNDFSAQHSWRFHDATRESGLDANNRRHSLAAAWEDYDNDGDLDLYVANDYGQNNLYRNDKGAFTDVAAEVGVVDFGSGMSASWGDFNRDGNPDLYVGNMWSSAGNRITTQRNFDASDNESTRSLYRRFAKGNTLFESDGEGGFHDVGAKLGVEAARWAWSSLFADIDNDGWEDLLVANGYLTTDDSSDL